jgi:hypothetical protein
LRGAIAAVLSELWMQLEERLPYSCGDLLARIRERGAVEFEYGDEEVRVHGRVPPSLAGDIARAAEEWRRARKARSRDEPNL